MISKFDNGHYVPASTVWRTRKGRQYRIRSNNKEITQIHVAYLDRSTARFQFRKINLDGPTGRAVAALI
jgi:hypothetical protein